MANYRQQTASALGASTACPTCLPDSTQLSLCYATTENALCCATSTSSVVFVAGLNVPNLASVTGLLYTTNTLQTQAAVGFYSDDNAITCTNPPVN
jgi:hypothetical protein